MPEQASLGRFAQGAVTTKGAPSAPLQRYSRGGSLELDHVGPGQGYLSGHHRRNGELIDGKLVDIGSLPGNGVDRDDRLVVTEECLGAGVEDGAIGCRAHQDHGLDALVFEDLVEIGV